LGLVAAPTAKPPIAPARIPIKARTIALSTKVPLPLPVLAIRFLLGLREILPLSLLDETNWE
jgi:hypothetical protein